MTVRVASASSQGRARLALVASVVVLLAGTAVLPFLFPPAQAQRGVSTAVGSNNQVAYVWYVVALVVPAVLLARLLPRPVPRPVPDLHQGWDAVDRRWLAIVIAGHVLVFAALFAYKGRFVFSEGIYFQGLLNRMSMGETPYVDFSYWYGPAMLYPADWLGAVAGLEAGYAIWHVATYCLGIVFLFVAVGAFLGRTRWTGVLSAALALALFNPMTGLNFTLTRYLMPTMVFLLAQQPILRGGRRRWAVSAAALSVAALYSFETAILGAASVVLLTAVGVGGGAIRSAISWLAEHTGVAPTSTTRAPWYLGSNERRALVAGVSLLVVATAVAVAVFAGIDPQLRALAAYPAAAQSDLSGAHNTPVYPEIPFMAMVAVTLIAAAGTFRALAWSPSDRGQLTLAAFLGLAVAAQRPSFSVSDPQHHLFFGLATLLLCLHITTRFPPVRRASSTVLALTFAGLVASMQIYQVYSLLPFFRAAGPATNSAAPIAAAPAVRRSADVEATLTTIAQRVGTARLYFMYRLDYYSVPVHHHLRLRYASYDTDLNSVTTADVVGRLIGELKARDAVVIIDRAELDTGKRAFQRDPLANAIAWATSAPMPGSDIQEIIFENDSRIQAPLLAFLRDECRVLVDLDGYVAVEPAR